MSNAYLDALPRRRPSAPPLPPEPPPDDPKVAEALRLVREPPVRTAPPTWVVLVLLVLFLGVELRSGSWVHVVLLALVLGFHELGHLFAMRAFGYCETRVLFLPFFGALTTSVETEASAFRRGLVLLAGPVPGVALACALVAVPATGHAPLTRALASYFAAVNLFNLYPVAALDGGRIIALFFSGRHPTVERAANRALVLGLAGVAVWQRSGTLGGLAFLAFIVTGAEGFRIRAADIIRRQKPVVPVAIADASEALLLSIVAALRTAFGRAFDGMKAKALADDVRSVHQRLAVAPPTAREGAALAALYGIAFAAGWIVLAVTR